MTKIWYLWWRGQIEKEREGDRQGERETGKWLASGIIRDLLGC